MIIFGWGHRKHKTFGPAKERRCGRCNNIVYLELVSVSTWFTLFFVPVIPYSNIRGLTCPICGMGIVIDKDEFDKLKVVTRTGRLQDYMNSDGTRKTETQINYINSMNELDHSSYPQAKESMEQGQSESDINEILIQTVRSNPEAENCHKQIVQNDLETKIVPLEPVGNKESITRATTSRLASLKKRFGAAIIDYLVVIGPLAMLFTESDSAFLVGLLLFVVFSVVQATLLSISGQSIGKKIFRIKIVKITNGIPGGFIRNYVVRSLINNLFSLTFIYLIVDLVFISRPDRRCLHDILAGTVIVDAN